VNNVFLTDADGFWEACLAQPARAVSQSFTTVAPGYAPPVFPKQSFYRMPVMRGPGPETALPPPDSNGIVTVPTIEMPPLERVYFPNFVFEDEDGSIIEPGRASSFFLSIRVSELPDFSGKISYRTVDLKNGKYMETAMPFRTGGPGDAGKIIQFEIPESFLKIYRAGGVGRQKPEGARLRWRCPGRYRLKREQLNNWNFAPIRSIF
jgi:hypothetical protein